MSIETGNSSRLLEKNPIANDMEVKDDLEPRPLGMDSLRRLYDLTDWRVVLLDDLVDREYGEHKIPAVSMFKALALPYLINIPTERAVGRELQERESLQQLCGFSPGAKIPSRETIWHFRNKYSDVYPDIMLKVLIAMVLSGKSPTFDLPFVRRVPDQEMPPEGLPQILKISEYQSEIEVWRTTDDSHSSDASNDSLDDSTEHWQQRIREVIKCTDDWAELRGRISEILDAQKEYYQSKRPKVGFVAELGLPVEVKTKLHDGTIVRFEIVKPAWVDMHGRVMDTLTEIGSTTREPYTVCNVLVLREHENRQQILLSRRLAGYGKGTYTLPGGRRRPNESLQECAARELREETGMHILESKPVSSFNFRLPGKPLVQSIGVLAEKCDGKPKLREPNQNTEWQWFDLDRLPVPLFRPTRIAINHYVNGTYPHLEWSDVEAQVQKLEELPRQLALPMS
jgi:8-oxo-dGTP diphosphatase